jgi:uncharacterized protein (DUF433 family)
MKLARVIIDLEHMDEVPYFRGLWTPVMTVVGMVADGMLQEEILVAYPDLGAEDIREAAHYAAESVQ